MINWKVRVKNKVFWMSLIPAALLLFQTVAALFGFTIDLSQIGDKLIDVVEAAFIVLAIIGVVADPTTEGVKDSSQALTYEKPKKDI